MNVSSNEEVTDVNATLGKCMYSIWCLKYKMYIPVINRSQSYLDML
jgi:hypothetical protein